MPLQFLGASGFPGLIAVYVPSAAIFAGFLILSMSGSCSHLVKTPGMGIRILPDNPRCPQTQTCPSLQLKTSFPDFYSLWDLGFVTGIWYSIPEAFLYQRSLWEQMNFHL